MDEKCTCSTKHNNKADVMFFMQILKEFTVHYAFVLNHLLA